MSISVDEDVAEAFLEWLYPHIDELLALDGFTGATVLSREAEIEGGDAAAPARRLMAVRYSVASRGHLQEYFDVHAARLRGDGMARFGGKFDISRRILTQLRQRQVKK